MTVSSQRLENARSTTVKTIEGQSNSYVLDSLATNKHLSGARRRDPTEAALIPMNTIAVVALHAIGMSSCLTRLDLQRPTYYYSRSRTEMCVMWELHTYREIHLY